MTPKRLIATETLDPNGALPKWITPAVRRLGWEAWPLPAQEAVHQFGPSCYADMVVAVIEQLRPHILLINPPYDYLGPTACQRIRELGTRIVGLVLDGDRYESIWDSAIWKDFHSHLDLWATTAVSGPAIASGAKSVPWTLAPESVAIDDPAAPSYDAVLIGHHTPQREEMARSVENAGIQIACFGAGWANGPVTRPSMLGLMRRAKVVITPNDGGTIAIARMVEAALVGACQVVEYRQDIERYFTDQDRPAIYRTADECIHLLTSRTSLHCYQSVPNWETLWPELIADLQLSSQEPRTKSTTLVSIYAALAHSYEQQGRILATRACLEAWNILAPEQWGVKFGLARCAHNMKYWQEAIAFCKEAEEYMKGHLSEATRNLQAFFPASGLGKGLGNSGAVDPRVELTAIRLHALVMNNQLETALSEIQTMSPTRKSTLKATIYADDDNPDIIELIQALTS